MLIEPLMEYASNTEGMLITWDYSGTQGVAQYRISRGVSGSKDDFSSYEIVETVDYPQNYYIDIHGLISDFYIIDEIDSASPPNVLFSHTYVWGEEALFNADIYWELSYFLSLRCYRDRLYFNNDRSYARAAMGSWNKIPEPKIEISSVITNTTGSYAAIPSSLPFPLAVTDLTAALEAASDATIIPGEYFYTIACYGYDSWGQIGNEDSFEIHVGDLPTHGISLTWTAVDGAVLYRVYRGTAAGKENEYYDTENNFLLDDGSFAWQNGSFPMVLSSPTNLTYTPIGTGDNEKHYYYFVSSGDGLNWMPPVGPVELDSTGSGIVKAKIAWDCIGAKKYKVYRSTENVIDPANIMCKIINTKFYIEDFTPWIDVLYEDEVKTTICARTTEYTSYDEGLKCRYDYNGKIYFLNYKNEQVQLNEGDEVWANYNFRALTTKNINAALTQAFGTLLSQPGVNKGYSSIAQVPVRWSRCIIAGASAYLLRQLALQLAVPEPAIFFAMDLRDPETTFAQVNDRFDKINGKSKEYMEEFWKIAENIRVDHYPGVRAIVTPEFQLPGGRSAAFRQLFKGN